MEINKKLQEFNKRWDIIENIDYAKEFIKFKQRVLNVLESIDSNVSKDSIKLFCQVLGIPEKWKHGYHDSYSENIINKFHDENNEKEFYRLIEIVLNFLEFKPPHYNNTFRGIVEAINLSNINLAITIKNDDEIILYPKGEKELDKILVNEVLSFLNDKSQKHFSDALNFYFNFSKKNSIKSAESIRRSLEEFLRFKLKNQKGLEKNLKLLQKEHKAKNSDSNIRNIIFQFFSYLDTYFNENSKHKDGNINKSENEFLIYQAGLLMRYINKLIP